MTPAEKLSKKKQRTRPKRNYPAKSEVVLWTTRLTEERELLNLSMKDVAKAVGLSVSAYFRIEKGYSDVALSNAMSIAQFFGTTVYTLWPQWRGADIARKEQRKSRMVKIAEKKRATSTKQS